MIARLSAGIRFVAPSRMTASCSSRDMSPYAPARQYHPEP
jgi:hypothetical protein